jgi:hypothetical protein
MPDNVAFVRQPVVYVLPGKLKELFAVYYVNPAGDLEILHVVLQQSCSTMQEIYVHYLNIDLRH